MFNRYLNKIIPVIGMVLILGGFNIQAVQAEPAMVIDDFGCGGFVPNGDTENGFPALGFVSTTESHAVKSSSGNQILTCHFNHNVALEKATAGRGFLCGTAFGITDDTQMIATPGGKATLVCKVNGSDG